MFRLTANEKYAGICMFCMVGMPQLIGQMCISEILNKCSANRWQHRDHKNVYLADDMNCMLDVFSYTY